MGNWSLIFCFRLYWIWLPCSHISVFVLHFLFLLRLTIYWHENIKLNKQNVFHIVKYIFFFLHHAAEDSLLQRRFNRNHKVPPFFIVWYIFIISDFILKNKTVHKINTILCVYFTFSGLSYMAIKKLMVF